LCNYDWSSIFFYPETQNIHLEQIDVVGAFATQRLEDGRRQYNTFPQQPIVNETRVPVTSEQNSSNQSNQINNNLHSILESDENVDGKNFDSSETVN